VLALVLSTLVWLAEATALPPSETLSLVGTVDRSSHRLSAVSEGSLRLDGGAAGLVSAPPGTSWQLVGDIRSQARLLRWSPSYSLSRDPRYPSGRYIAKVSMRHRIDIAPQAEDVDDLAIREVARSLNRVVDPLTETWPAALDQPAAIVAVWILDGRVIETQAKPVPATGGRREFMVSFEFLLDADQARGQPALLLWQGGTFAEPAVFSKNAATQDAYHAVFFDDVQTLRAAQEAGAKLDAASASQETTLAHYAAACGATKSLDLLLAARPRLLDVLNTSGASPLQWASGRGRRDVVALLLSRAAAERKPESQAPAAFRAAVESGHTDIVEMMVATLPKASLRETLGSQATTTAAWTRGYPDLCEFLAAQNPSTTTTGPAPRQSASLPFLLNSHAAQGNLPMVRHLLKTKGVDPKAGFQGETPLVAAAREGHESIVQLLLDAGVGPDDRVDGGTTPLMAAAKQDDPGVVALLLKAGARPNSANKEGMTALHFAAERNHGAIVSLLLDHGADTQLCTIREITPLDLALFVGATESVRLLSERGACIGLGAAYSQDLLLAAITHDIAAPVATALEQGWPSHSTFSGVWPALRVAEVLGADSCADVLRRAGATSQPDRPMAVVEAPELDAPLQLVSSQEFRDPRDPDAEFPASTIRVRMLIDGQGRPNFPRVLDRCEPRVHLALLKTAQQMRYAPPRRAAVPVAVFTTHEFRLVASTDRIFDETEIDGAARVTSERRPYLPRSASKKDRNARVVLNFVINVLGRAEQVEVAESSGPAYTDAALIALSQWEFLPGRYHSTPVPVRRTQTFSFDPKTP
jgi:TonB family protein